MRRPFTAALIVVACTASAQWTDVHRLGNGGETYVSTDGAGMVYVSSHIPVQVMVSHDWGATFEDKKEFDNALGDMLVYARPKGKAIIAYMYPLGTAGMATWNTDDYGKTWTQGDGIKGRPLDREWVTTDESTGAAYMIYSDGYIGGPRSKGVFVSKSMDGGLTWKEVGRVDKEAAGDSPVDPHLVSSSDGKLYGLWTTSKDYNTIDTYKFACSTDGGKTWTDHTTLGTISKLPGADTQERWMLGGLAASGKSDVLAFYVDYEVVEAGGKKNLCLLVHTRVSHDAGKTWSAPKRIVPDEELRKTLVDRIKAKLADENFPNYIQCLSWACYDATGVPHIIWQDNRDGQGSIGGHAYGRWQVRHAKGNADGVFDYSERVSHSIVCKRPPLDFICCAADSKYLYVTWTETPENAGDWNFSGEFWFGRKELAAK